MTGNWTVIEAAPVASLRCGGRISLPKEPDISFRLIAACFLGNPPKKKMWKIPHSTKIN